MSIGALLFLVDGGGWGFEALCLRGRTNSTKTVRKIISQVSWLGFGWMGGCGYGGTIPESYRISEQESRQMPSKPDPPYERDQCSGPDSSVPK
jgi:hypothetical protein